MTNWCRKVVLALALAVIPLQGAAATFSVLACLSGEDAHAAHSVPAHDGHDSGAPDHHGIEHGSHGDEGNSGGHSDQSCCYHLVSALPLAILTAAAPNFVGRSYTLLPLHDLFLPDRPQRPPLA